MKILVWHVHGGWMDAFVRGSHEYLLPTPLERATGRGGTGEPWPPSVREVDPANLADADVDVVVLQRLEEVGWAEELLGRRPGRDVPAVFVEHNTPKRAVPTEQHPLAGQDLIPIAHVTHFNDLIWDCGRAPTVVLEHGIADPGLRYTGERAHLGVVINDPVRRWRVTGTDLLPRFADAGRLEVFGMNTHLLPAAIGPGGVGITVRGNLPTAQMHTVLAGCRLYLHPMRWTSLGLSLIEAMHLGMPVVVLQSTEAARAVPPEAGAISTDVGELVRESAVLNSDPHEAAVRGLVAREFALDRYNLARFLGAWDLLLGDLRRGHRSTPRVARDAVEARERTIQ